MPSPTDYIPELAESGPYGSCWQLQPSSLILPLAFQALITNYGLLLHAFGTSSSVSWGTSIYPICASPLGLGLASTPLRNLPWHSPVRSGSFCHPLIIVSLSIDRGLPKHEAGIWLLTTPPTMAGCPEHDGPLVNIFRAKECLDGHRGL